MPVTVAVVGPPGAGKTTLFHALTAGRASDGVGMVDVPDERLDRLAAAVKPKRVVPAQVRVADAPPGSRAQRIAAAREADVVVKVVRGFGPEPDPVGDLEGIELDLALTDLATVERRLRAGYGLPPESGLGRVARAVWTAGGLITFFTAGEPEARAWPCERNAPAPVAAGVIHSDFEKHFIRAEVTSVDELVAAGSMEALRAAGKLRVEGREYTVKDGDVVFFRVGR